MLISRRRGAAPSFLDRAAPTGYAIAEYTPPQPSVETLDEEYGPLDDDVWQCDRSLRSVRDERWKFIEGSDGTADLYDLRADPDESAPVEGPSGEYADIEAASEQRLRDLGCL